MLNLTSVCGQSTMRRDVFGMGMNGLVPGRRQRLGDEKMREREQENIYGEALKEREDYLEYNGRMRRIHVNAKATMTLLVHCGRKRISS